MPFNTTNTTEVNMDNNVSTVFGKLANLSETLEKEIPSLNNLVSYRQANCDDGYECMVSLRKMKDDLKSYQKNIKSMKESLEFVKFNDYVNSNEELTQDIEHQVEKVVQYLKQYGYKAPNETLKLENKEHRDEGTGDNEENNENKENVENVTPSKNVVKPIPVDRTPDLADFGLSHLKSYQVPRNVSEYPKPTVETSSKYQTCDTNDSDKDKIECETPACFSHRGLSFSPGVLNGVECPIETPCLSRNGAAIDKMRNKIIMNHEDDGMSEKDVSSVIQGSRTFIIDRREQNHYMRSRDGWNDPQGTPDEPEVTTLLLGYRGYGNRIGGSYNSIPKAPTVNSQSSCTPEEPPITSYTHWSTVGAFKSSKVENRENSSTPEEPMIASSLNRPASSSKSSEFENHGGTPEEPEVTSTLKNFRLRPDKLTKGMVGNEQSADDDNLPATPELSSTHTFSPRIPASSHHYSSYKHFSKLNF